MRVLIPRHRHRWRHRSLSAVYRRRPVEPVSLVIIEGDFPRHRPVWFAETWEDSPKPAPHVKVTIGCPVKGVCIAYDFCRSVTQLFIRSFIHSFIRSFIRSFKKYLLTLYHVPGIMPGAGDIIVN